jgi:hypothetical protein
MIYKAAFVIYMVLHTTPDSGAIESTGLALSRWTDTAEKMWSYDTMTDVTTKVRSGGGLRQLERRRVRQRYMSGMWREDLIQTVHFDDKGMESVSDKGNGIAAFAFDGTTLRFYSSANQFAEIKKNRRDNVTRSQLFAPQIYEAFKATYLGQSYYNVFKERLKSAERLTEDGVVTINFKKTDEPIAATAREADITVKLSMEQGYQPILIRIGNHLGEAPDYMIDSSQTFFEVETGMWLPSKIVIRKYSSHPRFSATLESPIEETTVDIEIESLKYNIDIPNEVFELRPPSGTVVYNQAKDANYVINDRDEADYKAFSEVMRTKAAQLDSHMKTDDRSAKASGRSVVSGRLWLINLIVIALIIVVLFDRKLLHLGGERSSK